MSRYSPVPSENMDSAAEDSVKSFRKVSSIRSRTTSNTKQAITLMPQIKTVFTTIVLVLGVLIPLNLDLEASEARAACVILTTALLWMTEAIPLMITGFIPAVYFPLVGTMTTKEACAEYFNYVSMLMMGTFFVAEGVEACGLHRRIALAILSILGRGEALLMLGSALCTWVLSMFMSNTATTAMMLPIVGAIIESLREVTLAVDNDVMKVKYEKDGVQLSTAVDIVKADGTKLDSKRFKWFCKGLLLSVPYGASIGGIATLTGTPPNLVLKSVFEKTFKEVPEEEQVINYQTWFLFAFPLSMILVVVAWLVLCLIYARRSLLNLVTLRLCCGQQNKEIKKWNHVNKTIRKKYQELGAMRFPEIILLILAAALILLWLFRKVSWFNGWGTIHANWLNRTKPETGEIVYFLEDAWVVVAISLLLFVIPNQNPLQGRWTRTLPDGFDKFTRFERLLTIDTVMKKTPWDVLFILGGGYCIAEGCKISGLSLWIGEQFSFLQNSSKVVIALVVSAFVAVLTEFASNTASTTLLLPVLISLSNAIKVHPLYLMITGTISASLAFCLPSATGPNALVFSRKEIRVVDMIRTGVVMNIICVLVTVGATSSWVYSELNLQGFPCWADLNDTIHC